MKVGILTFHRTTNYGATLQAYALWKTIQEQGHDVEFIDYVPDKLSKAYFDHLYKNKFILFNALKNRSMKKFAGSQMQFSQKRYRTSHEMRDLNNSYDLVICGSDEIWNIDSSHTGFDKAYFLDFVQGSTRKLSYAASFGSTKELGSRKMEVTELLKSFNAISVRDETSLGFVKHECDLAATKVTDPTLLQTYDHIAITPKIDREYVLIYGGLSKEEQSYVRNLADSRGLDLIAVGYPCKAARVNQLSIGPREWLGYFSKASYVFTNFYHGVIFSIIFNKPFNCFYRDNKSQKVTDLLSSIGLQHRILKDISQTTSPDLNYEVEFDRVKLQKMIQESKLFLQSQLKH